MPASSTWLWSAVVWRAAEKNVSLFLNTYAYRVEKSDSRIQAVVARSTHDSREMRFPAPWFADCTGDGTLGFLAGRDPSVTHVALGTVRVQRTTGMMGEVLGMAASLCKKHNADPRGVYDQHLEELKALMSHGVGRDASPTSNP